MIQLAAFFFGVVFALGLGLSGMTQPEKVLGFLDVGGDWDPTLAFVMGGAVMVTLTVFPLILRRRASLFGERFVLPEKKDIDARLILGAILFGIGWGLAGYCPGPALVSLATLWVPVVVFVAAMGVGLYVGGRVLSS